MTTPTIEIMPSRLNFRVRMGSTLRRTLTWYSDVVWLDSDRTEVDTQASTPADLTNYTARMQIRTAGDGALVAELTTENGGITLGGNAGTIALFLSDADTEEPASDECEYDIELEDAAGDVTPLLYGRFKFEAQVTT